MSEHVTVDLQQLADYRFEVRYDNPAIPHLQTDEAGPIGGDTGPNPVALLTTAVANCLSASLLFAMRKFKNEPGPIRTTATATIDRNEKNRLRVAGIAVDIHLGIDRASIAMVGRILAQFEDFCTVTQSVRGAIPVTVRVFDRNGEVLEA